ncbi:rCG42911 [Rattus norvegicus]|uniref:RCG42911 n=1 Tax=Rattus norvegicus TaxID=10116 RepID=A6JZY8_RAT|nr:rCG42911 [Rattus norvegicus]
MFSPLNVCYRITSLRLKYSHVSKWHDYSIEDSRIC